MNGVHRLSNSFVITISWCVLQLFAQIGNNCKRVARLAEFSMCDSLITEIYHGYLVLYAALGGLEQGNVTANWRTRREIP